MSSSLLVTLKKDLLANAGQRTMSGLVGVWLRIASTNFGIAKSGRWRSPMTEKNRNAHTGIDHKLEASRK